MNKEWRNMLIFMGVLVLKLSLLAYLFGVNELYNSFVLKLAKASYRNYGANENH